MQNICKKLSGQVISLNKNQQLINNWTITVRVWGVFFGGLEFICGNLLKIRCFRIRNNLYNENYLVQLDVATSIKKACQFQVRFLLAKLTEL
jgi:hypothetical protein